jgi:hypothetical protein
MNVLLTQLFNSRLTHSNYIQINYIHTPHTPHCYQSRYNGNHY